ncbi:MAG: MFS transporter, partial [Pseudomonadota bacterium]
PSAIAVSSSYVQVAVFAGPAFAGWIISVYGVSWAFFVNAVGYFVLTCAFLALRTPAGYVQTAPEPGSVLEQIRGGVVYLIRDRRILTLLILGVLVNAMTVGTFHMLPAYSELMLGMGVEGMSIILAIEGIGATLAALWMARGGAHMATPMRVVWAVLVAVVAAAALICTPSIYLAAVFALALGVAAEVRRTGAMTLVQMNVEERQRGRVMGSWFMFAQIAGGIGAYGIGHTATSFGLQWPTVIAAGVCIVVWLCVYINRDALLFRSTETSQITG